MANESPIGIFDSGVGGLTVFAAVKAKLLNESIVYLGDTARVPYGTKSDETVVRYALEDSRFLEERGVKAIVVACNTASAVALSALREHCSVPVVGVVEPGAKAALEVTRRNSVGVVGTQTTILSNAYGRMLKNLDPKVGVVSMSCPLFVPLVEEGWLDGGIAQAVADEYLKDMRSEGIDALILGCTHYPLLKSTIGRVMGEGVKLIDSGEAAANTLAELLRTEGLLSNGTQPEPDRIYVTDVPQRFESIASRFLGGELPKVRRVDL
jgi:glutamate racemase